MPGDGRLTPKPPAPEGRGGMPLAAWARHLCRGPAIGPTRRARRNGRLRSEGVVAHARRARGRAWHSGTWAWRGSTGSGARCPGRRRTGRGGRIAGRGRCGSRRRARGRHRRSGPSRRPSGAGVTGDTGAAQRRGAGAATGSAARGLSAVRAVARAAGAGGAAGAAAGFGNDSRSLRTTGASMVDDADRTNSPNS